MPIMNTSSSPQDPDASRLHALVDGRLVIRPSGTEPVIRVMAEGDDRVSVETAVDEVIDAITKAA